MRPEMVVRPGGADAASRSRDALCIALTCLLIYAAFLSLYRWHDTHAFVFNVVVLARIAWLVRSVWPSTPRSQPIEARTA